MRAFFAAVALLVLPVWIATGLPQASLSASLQPVVIRVTIDGPIHPITAEIVGDAIAQARSQQAALVLLKLNTPGGLVDAAREITQEIVASPVPIVAYVTPSGARAASAGFFLLEAADVAVMAPGTNTGAAHPVNLGGEKMDDVMKQKVENDSAAFMRSFVGPRGRSVALAESAVRESKSWTDKEALDQHLIDYVATSQADLFKQIDGKPIKRFDGKTVTLHLIDAQVNDCLLYTSD